MFIGVVLFSLSNMGQQPQEPPKMKTLYKTARLALKTTANQEAAKQGLLAALARPELTNKDKCKIYYTAAELDESSNSVINQMAFLKQKYDSAALFNTVLNIYVLVSLSPGRCRGLCPLSAPLARERPCTEDKTWVRRSRRRLSRSLPRSCASPLDLV